MNEDLSNAVFSHPLAADAIGRITGKLPEDISSDVYEFITEQVSKLGNEIITLAESTSLPYTGTFDPTASVWQNAAQAFMSSHKDDVVRCVSACERELKGIAPDNLPLMQLAYSFALLTMLGVAAFREAETQ